MDANSNVLFFCGAGKDRTGVVSEIDLNTIVPNEDNIKRVLKVI